MSADFMLTVRKYQDETPVPYPSYRCKATSKKVSNDTTHPCKIVVDHDGDHKCICNHTWEREEKKA